MHKDASDELIELQLSLCINAYLCFSISPRTL